MHADVRRPGPSLSAVVWLIAAMGCGAAASDQSTAPLLEGMGSHHFDVTTTDTLAQRYFDQGLVLAYAFNHAEAARSFREAIRRDSACAMCWWGLAYALGPNINATMEASDNPEAYAAARAALNRSDAVSDRERAFIEAMATRYIASAPDDRSPLDTAYADAMSVVASRFADDADAQALYAEALMVTTPWDYWNPDGSPKPETEIVLAELEKAMARDSLHPGANHFYIHVVEKPRPELGMGAADRLRHLVPGAGHLVHMPGHIDIRVGRYHEAVLANQRAIAADRAYQEQAEAQGLYPLAYVPHNFHFLWAAASLEGNAELAIDAAIEMSAAQDSAMMREPGFGTLQHYWVTPIYAYLRFGRWDRILGAPRPAEDLVYPIGVWHYARGIALLRTGDVDGAERELGVLMGITGSPQLESVTIWDLNTTANLLHIARSHLIGEIALARGSYLEAIQMLRAGIRIENQLTYDEPPPWYLPLRQVLGVAYLAAGRPGDAERVYREDLEAFPENGWSLYGLRDALAAQDRTREAEEVGRRFDAAWQHADVTLTASRF